MQTVDTTAITFLNSRSYQIIVNLNTPSHFTVNNWLLLRHNYCNGQGVCPFKTLIRGFPLPLHSCVYAGETHCTFVLLHFLLTIIHSLMVTCIECFFHNAQYVTVHGRGCEISSQLSYSSPTTSGKEVGEGKKGTYFIYFKGTSLLYF